MNGAKYCLWLGVLFLLVFPWFVATVLSWIYSEAYDSVTDGPGGSNNNGSGGAATASRIIAIIQTCGGFLYVLYILLAILWIGCQGRASLCSYCCLVLGIPIFFAIPVAGGITLLVEALNNKDGIGRDVGLAAAVCCFMSTALCIALTWVALICGSKGKGRNHRFPVPLAYFPILEEFDDFNETEISDVERFTKDYPPPLSSFRDRKLSSTGSGGSPSKGNGRRPSTVSQKSNVSGRRSSDTNKDSAVKTAERRVLASANSRLSSSSNSLNSRNDRKVSVSSTLHQPEQKVFTVSSNAGSSRGRDRKQSAASNNSFLFSTNTDNKSSETTKR